MSIGIPYNKYRISYNDGEFDVMTEELTAFDDDYIIKRAKKLESEGVTNVKAIKYSEEEIYSSKKPDLS